MNPSAGVIDAAPCREITGKSGQALHTDAFCRALFGLGVALPGGA